MNNAVVKLYYRLVKAGSRTLDELTDDIRTAVQVMIDAETAESESENIE